MSTPYKPGDLIRNGSTMVMLISFISDDRDMSLWHVISASRRLQGRWADKVHLLHRDSNWELINR